MRLFYGTNFWSHQQSSVAGALATLLGPGAFHLGLFCPVDEERARMGWTEAPEAEPWVLGPPRDPEEARRLWRACLDADVAVLGDVPMDLRLRRAETGRLTFLMTERLWKRPLRPWRYLNPFFVRWLRRHRVFSRRPNVHCLAIGAHAADDEALIGTFGDRFWTWGYFAPVSAAPPRKEHGRAMTLLWAGRMVGFKRVDTLLRAVAALPDRRNLGGVRLLGDGVMKSCWSRLAHDLGLSGEVSFVGFLTPAEVRAEMGRAQVFVFPSDRGEGWGMVLNEAMSEGCVVVASDAAGATRVLVQHDRTGYVFPCGRADVLAETLWRVLADAAAAVRVGTAAWEHMRNAWSPEIAAERLVRLCQGLIGIGPPPAYPMGPCSRVHLDGSRPGRD